MPGIEVKYGFQRSTVYDRHVVVYTGTIGQQDVFYRLGKSDTKVYLPQFGPTSNDTVAVDGTGVDDAYLGVDDTAPPASFIGGMVEV